VKAEVKKEPINWKLVKTSKSLLSTRFPRSVYKGEYQDGFKQGWGTETYSNGCEYTGEYYQDSRHGNGRYSSFKGNVYEGQFANNIPKTPKPQ
jgi:hypothetical protein